MNRDTDKKAIGIWLECHNELNGTRFQIESYPDELDRNSQNIDALCLDSDGRSLGLEHTRVEAVKSLASPVGRF
jgi:hypothetical protein